jgi:transcriptional regulator with XRE-family HTH domain
MSVIGNNIKKYRKMKGLSQEQLADMLGKKKTAVSNWEAGYNKPDADTIERLLDILDVDANMLLGWDNPQRIKDDAAKHWEELYNDPAIRELALSAQKLSKKDIEFMQNFINKLLGKDG